MQTFTGMEYLKIDVANNFGLNRKTWDHRLNWFNENENQLEELLEQAKEPALYFAGVQAYHKAMKKEVVNYPISLDATASGIQMLSLLSGCVQSAFRCNAVSLDDERKDVYQEVFDEMQRRLGKEVNIEYDDTKKSVMTSFFSSIAVPRDTFGEGSELLDIFYEVVSELLPGAWELNEALLAIWQPDVLSHDWIMPNNFHVKIKVMEPVKEKVTFFDDRYVVHSYKNKPSPESRSLPANITHSVDGFVVGEMVQRCNNTCNWWEDNGFHKHSTTAYGTSKTRGKDKTLLSLLVHTRNSGFMSARILDCLDIHNIGNLTSANLVKLKELIASLPEKSFQVLPTHDCFRALPNYGNDIRKQYNTVLQSIVDSDLLAYIVSQITNRIVTVNKRDNFGDMVLNANYALS